MHGAHAPRGVEAVTRQIDISTLTTGPVVVRNAVKSATDYADTMRAQGKPLSEIKVFAQTYVRLANAARRSAKVGNEVNIHLHYRGIPLVT